MLFEIKCLNWKWKEYGKKVVIELYTKHTKIDF